MILENAPGESRLKIYLKASCFALPPVAAAQFVNLFLLPKLTYLQADAGLSDAQIYGFMTLPRFLAEYGLMMLLAFMAVLFVMEWRFRLWERYRKAALATSVFVVNTAVLVELTSVIMAAFIIAPFLMRK